MSQINRIRNLYGEGWSVAKISRELEIDEKTARKYLAREDFSPKAPEKVVMVPDGINLGFPAASTGRWGVLLMEKQFTLSIVR